MSDPSSNKVFKNHRAVESPFAYATSVFLPSFKNQIQKHKYANSPPAVASQAKPIKELETLDTCSRNTRTTNHHDSQTSESRHLQFWPSLVLHHGFPSHVATKPQINMSMLTAPPLRSECKHKSIAASSTRITDTQHDKNKTINRCKFLQDHGHSAW